MATAILFPASERARREGIPPAPLASFEPFQLPSSNQRLLGTPHPDGTVIPLALKLASDEVTFGGTKPDSLHDVTLQHVLEIINHLANKGELDRALALHGALLFRDLPIYSAEDFSKFAHAFGYKPHEIIGIVVNRPVLAPNIAPANESPLTTTIGSHNESPQVPHAPAYVMFYCHRAPEKGGETPIGSSIEIFQKVSEEIPEFVKDLSEKGVRHTIIYKPTAQYKGGSTLATAFGKLILEEDDEETRKRKIEQQILRYDRDSSHTTWEWGEDGSITLRHILPAIRTQPDTGIPGFFTNLAAQYAQRIRAPNDERGNIYKPPTYGDGTPIPDTYLEVLLRITEETRVLHKWKRGDVLVFDNRVAQHGREPWEGVQEDRQVLASLWDGTLPGPYGNAAFSRLVPALPDL